VTLREHVDRYLDVHAATRDPNTIRVLRERLRRPIVSFGNIWLRDLERMSGDLATWQTTLPERSRYGVMQALRQAFEAAVRWGDMTVKPAKLAGANPPPPLRGVQTSSGCCGQSADHGAARAPEGGQRALRRSEAWGEGYRSPPPSTVARPWINSRSVPGVKTGRPVSLCRMQVPIAASRLQTAAEGRPA
jgi:hypothetical protein